MFFYTKWCSEKCENPIFGVAHKIGVCMCVYVFENAFLRKMCGQDYNMEMINLICNAYIPFILS